MSQHTPGPWIADGQDVNVAGNNKSPRIAYCPKETALRHGIPRSEALANAKLIAAAPGMAEALKRLLSCPGIHQTDQESGQTFAVAIHVALDKAGL